MKRLINAPRLHIRFQLRFRLRIRNRWVFQDPASIPLPFQSAKMEDISTLNTKTAVWGTSGEFWEDAKLQKTSYQVPELTISLPSKTFLPKGSIVFQAHKTAWLAVSGLLKEETWFWTDKRLDLEITGFQVNLVTTLRGKRRMSHLIERVCELLAHWYYKLMQSSDWKPIQVAA